MEYRRQLLMSGVFIVIGMVVILISIMMLGGDNHFFQPKNSLYVKFDQVQGLNPGAVVSLAGLPIGNVKGFDFDGRKIRVHMVIRSADFRKLTRGLEAEIRTQGALGDKYIYLTAGSPEAPSLEDGTEVSAKVSTDLIDILSDKGKETEKIFEIINEAHLLLKTLNDSNRVGKIMANFEDSSSSFKKVTDRADQSFQRLDRILLKVENGEGTLGALISDPSIHDQIKSMLGGSQRKSHVKTMLRKSVQTSESESGR